MLDIDLTSVKISHPAFMASNLGKTGTEILARMDRIPVWSLPSSFLLIIGIGYFFTFFDISDIGFAMHAIAIQLNITGSETLFVALAIGLVGYIIG